MCVCVFAIACSPHPSLRPPDVHSPMWGAMDACVKIASDPCRGSITLCITRETVGVCVCVCHCLLSYPPLCPPDAHSLLV